MTMEKQALLLIDIQNIYFTEGEYLLYQPEKAAQKAKKVLDIFRQKQLPIIHVKHEFKIKTNQDSKAFLNEINKIVEPKENEKIILKQYPNAFLHTDLYEYLQKEEITHLVVAGMMSHMCIDTTVRACQDYGFKVTVIDDACTTKALHWNHDTIHAKTVHNTYMAGLNGMFAHLVQSDVFIRES